MSNIRCSLESDKLSCGTACGKWVFFQNKIYSIRIEMCLSDSCLAVSTIAKGYVTAMRVVSVRHPVESLGSHGELLLTLDFQWRC